MNWELLLHKFGYLAIFLGTFFEGETVLVLSGFFASRRHLSILIVVLVAASGAFVGHLFWFWLGRTQGARIVHHFPKLEKHMDRGLRLFEEYGAMAIFITQYLYGLRVASAVVFGISHISVRKFVLFQAISCATWAALIASLGYYFGRAVTRFLGGAAEVEKYAILTIIAIALLIFLYHRIRARLNVAANDE
jgi:membrane protein DedA with SNARE-associated domain